MIKHGEILRLGPLYLLAVAAPVSVSAGGIAVGLVLAAALGTFLLDRQAAGRPDRRVLWALTALIGAYFLATVFAAPFPSHWHKLLEENWIKLLLVAVPVLLGRRSDHAVRIVKVAVLVGMIAGLYAVWQHFAEFDPIRHRSIVRAQWGHPAVTGFFSHHLSFGGQVIIFFLLTLSWFFSGAFRWRRAWLPVALAVLGAALVWSFARSALLGTLAGGFCLVLLLPGRRRWAALGTLAAGMGAALSLPAVRAHLFMLLEMKRHVTRLNLWESSWHGIQARPVLGFGPGNFEALLAGHKVDGYYETLAHSHNDLLMHGVNAGVPGMLAALGLLLVTCWLFLKALKTRPPQAWILAGTLAVQAGITVAGLFQVYQTDDEVEILLYFVLGCALAVAGSCRPEGKPEKSGV